MIEAQAGLAPYTQLRLAKRSDPLPEEGILGYLLRLADANRYGNLFDVANSRPKKGLYDCEYIADDQLMQIAARTGCPVDLLRATSGIKVSNRRVLFMGEPIPDAFVDSGRPKVCPRCLSERRVLRAEWDLYCWVACPIHKCRMVTRCPQCKAPLSWRRRWINACCAEFPLSEAPTSPAPAEITKLISRMAHLASRGHQPLDGELAEIIEGVRLPNLLRLVNLLGALDRSSRARRAMGMYLRRLTFGEAESAINISSTVLTNWPCEFYCLLDRVASRRGDEAPHSVVCALGYALYQFSEGPVSDLDFVRHEFGNYLTSRYSAARRRITSIEKGRKSKLIGLTQAAAELGITKKRVRRLIESGSLNAKIWTTKSNRRLCRLYGINEADLSSLALHLRSNAATRSRSNAASDNLLTRTQMSQRLGVRGSALNQICEAGLVECLSSLLVKTYSAESVESLLASFERQSSLADAQPGPLLPFWRAAARLGRHAGIVALVRGVLGGHLTPVMVLDAVGLKRYRFAPKDLDLLAEKTSSRISETSVAAILRCRRPTVTALIEKGLLDAERITDYRGKMSFAIHVSSLEEFKRTYVLAATLSTEVGISPNSIATRLIRENITPILKADQKRHIAPVWRRDMAVCCLARG